MNIQKSNLNFQHLSFKGHNKAIDKTGYEQHKFYYLYDSTKYDCALELYNIDKKFETDNYRVKEDSYNDNNLIPAKEIPMDRGFASVDMFDVPEIYSQDGFAYRFKLTEKGTGKISYAYDNGALIGIFKEGKNGKDNKFNVVLNNRAIINKNGPMQLIMPDEYYPGIVNEDGKPSLNEALRANVLSSVRTHATKLGGNFYGIISRLPELQKEGISRIVGTPFTRDTISSHLYWTENAYQVAPTLGNEEDFKKLQVELFKNGINWVADAALVNEGFGGIHFSELLRKGSDSYSKNMFRAGEKISLGILPDAPKDTNTRMKIINARFLINEDGSYEKENPNYNPSKPTYIQFYDARLASDEQKKSDSPLRLSTYDNKNTDNIYDITKHDHAVYPFPLEVNPYELERNIGRVLKNNDGKVDLGDVKIIKQVADFTNFKVVNKASAGGLEVWDGNVDIAKLNFYASREDDARFSKLPKDERAEAIADFERGTLAVRDYAINSGKYWTKTTADAQLSYLANLLSSKNAQTAEDYLAIIKEESEKGNIPKSALNVVDLEVVQNVLENNYNLRRLNSFDINPETGDTEYNLSDYILKQSMDVPLETLPFATNLLGIITSPYIAKKANIEEELGVSRYHLFKEGDINLPDKYSHVYAQANALYQDLIVPKISTILADIPHIVENGKVSDYGKYVISEITPDLTRYLLIKAISPKSEIRYKSDGHLDFTNVNPEDIAMQSIGIQFDSLTSEEEAQKVINTMKKGLSLISDEDLRTLKKHVENHFVQNSVNDYKVAEMILDRTESGLGWRIDAAKDIAPIDAVRSGSDNISETWTKVIDFWKLYNQSVLDINPHSYTTAEITDLDGLFAKEINHMLPAISEWKKKRYEVAGTDKEMIEDVEKDLRAYFKEIAGIFAGRRYIGGSDAERKFLNDTGITSVANYSYFYSLLPEMFGRNNIEHGGDNWMSREEKNHELRKKLDYGWKFNDDYPFFNTPGFLFQSPDDGVTNSYTFIGNHDKPRILHCMALDMGLFNSDFSETKVEDRKRAAVVLNKDVDDIDFAKESSMAIAMGERIHSAFDDVVKRYPSLKNDEFFIENINSAVADLASGNFKGKTFDKDAFGTRPIEVAISSVLDQYEYNTNEKVPNRKELETSMLKNILTPAFDRFYSMYKLLNVLPGSPTDFAGDRVGSTGYETKAKNYHQQNRNVIRWEWLDEKNSEYSFIREYYNNMNKIASIRKNPKLSALNDGATVTLPIVGDKREKLQAFLRYNEDSVVLTLHDLSGASTEPYKKMNRSETKTSIDKNSIKDRIVLDTEGTTEKQGLKHGLKKGMVFKDYGSTFEGTRKGDDSVYKVDTMEQDGKVYYYLKREDANGNELPITISPEDHNTLILYKE